MFTTGRTIILIGNLMYGVGAFIADFNETHVKNPRWPPHARFHNGQSMTLGALLCATSIYFAFRPSFSTTNVDATESVLWAALIGSFYCAAAWAAILFPGTDWKDPEFEHGGEQKYLFGGIVVLMWVGYVLEVRRLGRGGGKKRN